MAEQTTIPLSKGTRDDLKKFGRKDETYDEIIERLMKVAETQLLYERHKKILETERFVPLDEV